MNKVNNPSNVNFTSLKPQKLVGEKVLREFNKEMGYLKSSSAMVVRINRNQKKLDPARLCSLREKENKLSMEIYDEFLCIGIDKKPFKSFKDFNKALIANIKQKGNKANCWEDMMIVFTKLLEKGEKPRNFRVEVSSESGRHQGNHFATVIGLKPNAKITDPKTWGSKAVIIDAWSKMVKPAHEALEDIKMMLLNGEKVKTEEYKPVFTSFILE
jgi:hypothetical protein